MAYADFSLDSVADDLGLNIITVDLFPDLGEALVPPWLRDALERGSREFPVSEKARSEFIVAPILLACKEQSPGPLSIQSGVRLDVDPARGLVGECDFIISATPPVPGLRAPLITIVEAKKHDIEAAIWQCFAQMVGARLFNDRAGRPIGEIYGCVTNAEAWQFLRLAGDSAEIDRPRHYIDDVGSILAVFGSILTRHAAASKLAK
jgi:hypothetical protein